MEKRLNKELERLAKVKRIVSKFKLTEEDANRLGELAKQNRLKELKSKGLV